MENAQIAGLRSFDQILIGGEWTAPESDARIEVISPVTEGVIATVPEAGTTDIDKAVTAAREAFDDGPWPQLTAEERAGYLRRIIEELEARLPEMEAAFTAEIGAPTVVSTAFHSNALDIWRDAATLWERVPFEERRDIGAGEALVVNEPVGVVGMIVPWNGPVASASFKLAPALAAGCCVVLKPAYEGPVSMMVMADALAASELPDGVISVLPAGREIGEHLVSHPGVDKVSFTGSTAAGKRVMGACSERIARVTLELGGKSAGIVLDDIPFDQVLPTLLPAGFGNTGQVCAALTRILVPRERHDEFVVAAREFLAAITVGDPTDPGTMVGPLVAKRQLDRVQGYIALGVEEGAELVFGGNRPEGLDKGWFIEPTLFANVDNSMRIAREEIFGPVLSVIPYDGGVEEAIKLANDSEYGLAGAVYTRDPALGELVARRVRTGQISVNTAALCVVAPFGGFKMSGIGREGGIEGLAPYLEQKVIQGV